MNASWQDQLRYRFDNFMSKGTGALIAGLGVLSLIVIAVMGAIISLAGIAPEGSTSGLSFWEAAWESMMRTLDAGTMGGDQGWSFRIAMFVVTLGGVFIISTLIGVLTSGIEGKVDELRKGRSKVLESGHTVILGWSPKVFSILSELVIANENQPRPCIVILADKDKVEMEDEIRAALEDPKNTRIVCRTGNPINLNDLEIASLHTSKSVVILTNESEDPDAQTIKTILAITNNPKRREQPYHIVAEIQDSKNMQVAHIVGKDEVELVETASLISRIIAQTCRQSGLSVVYTELLDFGGDEIYFKDEPSLVGKTFHAALACYRTSTVIGLWSPQAGSRLNPPMDTRIVPGDQLIAISADDDTIVLEPMAMPVDPEPILQNPPDEAPAPERTLILGWNAKAPAIINELEQYVAPSSEVLVVAEKEDGQAEIEWLCSQVTKQQIAFKQADTTDRRVLEEISPLDFDHIIVLSYSESKDIQTADACTLMTLLHLRDMAEKSGKKSAIVSEMQDIQNRVLAEVTHADDFIVSDRLISLIMTQVSENKALNAVFTDIFDPEGSEIYLKPMHGYIKAGLPVDFYTVTEAAARRSEVAIGYRLKKQANDANQAYGIHINPDKSEKVIFSDEDKIVVIAED